MTTKEAILARMLAATEYPSPAQWAELYALPVRDILDIAKALTARLAVQCDDHCAALVEANMPSHPASKAHVDALLQRLRLAPGSEPPVRR